MVEALAYRFFLDPFCLCFFKKTGAKGQRHPVAVSIKQRGILLKKWWLVL
jgi:hypothetical protein